MTPDSNMDAHGKAKSNNKNNYVIRKKWYYKGFFYLSCNWIHNCIKLHAYILGATTYRNNVFANNSTKEMGGKKVVSYGTVFYVEKRRGICINVILNILDCLGNYKQIFRE